MHESRTEFDLNSLRVVDLKKILHKRGVSIPRSARKADLIELLKAQTRTVEGRTTEQKADQSGSSEDETDISSGADEERKAGDTDPPGPEQKPAAARVSSPQVPPSKVTKPRAKIPRPKRVSNLPPAKASSPAKGKIKNLVGQSVPQKRSLEDGNDDADATVHKEYSKILKKQTNHKRVFSSSAATTPNNSTIVSPKKQTNVKVESSPSFKNGHETPSKEASQEENTVVIHPKSEASQTPPPADTHHDESFVVPTLPSSTPMVFNSPRKPIPPLDVSDFAAQLQKLSGPTKPISLDRPEEQNSSKPESPDSTNDEEVLTQLQHEIDVTQEQIEEKSKQALKSIGAAPPSNLVYRLVTAWLLTLSLMYAFTSYREQRIRIGFCGSEVYSPLFEYDRRAHPVISQYLDKIESIFTLSCVPCPEHGQCFPYSRLYCDPDYTIYKPLKSLFGIIPTYQTCVLDSVKVKKIDKMVKLATDLLNRRNAEYKCGRGEDHEVGMTIPHLQNYIIETFDLKDDDFDYLWEKTFAVLKQRPELVIGDNFIRSNSLSKLSIKCRLIRMFMDVFVRLKWHLLALVLFASLIKYMSVKFTQYRNKRILVNELTTKTIEKLRKQAELYRLGQSSQPYIGKIQLRDYYLIDASLSAKQKAKVWNEVSKHVETNSNVKTYMTEVRGEMFKVWEWIATI
ncbi:hypothetical protein KL933_001672 [Ogataea haglerorum]|uniref:Uncharacterized protein n=1 Tax=Ogataea haglerorum TaxID=1937702 RepID=A0AAN6D8A6_9ASCO|nr:hypothetical protein KL933_001672 [Ogataea haglerorum]KAG7791732.1 hypothetical protein KL910_001858 [Ogataea haglerorum]KAG7792477.1 hypothetical protein KL945_000758 [Ogataea haglerorum]